MLKFYGKGPDGFGLLEPSPEVGQPDPALAQAALWLDLEAPSEQEREWLQQALSLTLPSEEVTREIEPSSRIYQQGDWYVLTIPLVWRVNETDPGLTEVTLLYNGKQLITLRPSNPKAMMNFQALVQKEQQIGESADRLLVNLLDCLVARSADVLELAGADLSQVSRQIFSPAAARRDQTGQAVDLEAVLRKLGRLEDLTSLTRESLMVLTRTLNLLQAVSDKNPAKRRQLKSLGQDVRSLQEQAAFLVQKCEFCLDATLGLINLQQTKIIKIFSVLAMVFMPPTLIASIYGMNFEFMPELSWRFGYLLAIVVMFFSSLLPYLYFRRRGWL
ncbi:CorA family divalent cation transporter [Rhodovibrionaceae bacterium A322]